MKLPIEYNDEILLDRLREGDDSAMSEIYQLYWQPLFIVSYNVLQNREQCEDIIQEVFLSIWARRTELKISSSLKGYLYASVRYQVFAKIRKNVEFVRSELFENIDQRIQYSSPETELLYKELVEQIDSVISTLPTKCRKVYTLSRNEQLSHKEISTQLYISTKTVENHISKALHALKTSFRILTSLILSFII